MDVYYYRRDIEFSYLLQCRETLNNGLFHHISLISSSAKPRSVLKKPAGLAPPFRVTDHIDLAVQPQKLFCVTYSYLLLLTNDLRNDIPTVNIHSFTDTFSLSLMSTGISLAIILTQN
jgi:hypothetical protein